MHGADSVSRESHLSLEVVDHPLNAKGSVSKEADVVSHPTVAGGDEVRQAEVGGVILLGLLPQPMEPVPPSSVSLPFCVFAGERGVSVFLPGGVQCLCLCRGGGGSEYRADALHLPCTMVQTQDCEGHTGVACVVLVEILSAPVHVCLCLKVHVAFCFLNLSC